VHRWIVRAIWRPTATYRVSAGEVVRCTFTDVKRGQVILAKQAEPAGDLTGFLFSGDLSGSVKGGQTLAKEVVPGVYTAHETVPAGWDLTGIQCTDADSTGDLATGTATYRVSAGEAVQCTFINVRRGAITIVKNARPNESRAFAFDGDLGPFALADDGASPNWVDFDNLVPGDYRIAEQVPDDWQLTGLICVDQTVGPRPTSASPGLMTRPRGAGHLRSRTPGAARSSSRNRRSPMGRPTVLSSVVTWGGASRTARRSPCRI
jgi:hypothetical protein